MVVLGLMHVQNFNCQTVNGVEMLLFLELTIILVCMLILKKNIFVLGEGRTRVLDDTTITAEAKYPVNFTRPGRRFRLRLHHNESNSFLFVNATKCIS